ncbi:MAG: hypothetical protein LBH90_00065, partial [Tannerella sp.]|nr:hypothetical protein [Tannerella sp.]
GPGRERYGFGNPCRRVIVKITPIKSITKIIVQTMSGQEQHTGRKIHAGLFFFVSSGTKCIPCNSATGIPCLTEHRRRYPRFYRHNVLTGH